MSRKPKVFKLEDLKKSTQVIQDSRDGGSSKKKYMKLGPNINKVLLLPPWGDTAAIMKKIVVHQVWKNKKLVLSATSPRSDDADSEDKVMVYGFDLKTKYQSSSSKVKQDLWKKYMPRVDTVVNVLNLANKNPVPELLRLPACAITFLCDEINELSNLSEGANIWDLEKGFPLIIKGNGKDGNDRRYEYAKWSKNPAKLITLGIVDEDQILDNIPNLDNLVPPYNEKKLNDVLLLLKKQDQAILNNEGDEETDDDDDEKPVIKKSKKPIKDDDEESEEEVEDGDVTEDDDDIEETDFDDEVPVKKKQSKNVLRKK